MSRIFYKIQCLRIPKIERKIGLDKIWDRSHSLLPRCTGFLEQKGWVWPLRHFNQFVWSTLTGIVTYNSQNFIFPLALTLSFILVLCRAEGVNKLLCSLLRNLAHVCTTKKRASRKTFSKSCATHPVKVESCKLYNNKYIITSTQTANTEGLAFTVILVFLSYWAVKFCL